MLPDKCTAGNAAVLSFASYSGVRPNGDYWVFLEVNEAAMGGRPLSDGPDTVEELMRNTRNNPLEDLGMHLPLICDRYEVRDDVPPGAGKFRGGAGVVKSQRYLTPGFMTHESDRNEDAPWGIFGGKHGACQQGRAAQHADRQGQLPAGQILRAEDGGGRRRHLLLAVRRRLRRSAGARPAKVLDDVLDGFITVDHARADYGVVLGAVDDGYGWALKEATRALRTEMRRG